VVGGVAHALLSEGRDAYAAPGDAFGGGRERR
jgi:hypothetical protein